MEWRDIPGFSGYQASDTGLIRSIDRCTTAGDRIGKCVKGRLLKPIASRYKRGRIVCLFVNPSINGVASGPQKVHRLVLLAFVGPCPEGMEGCHNNGDPTDNMVGNLRWDTHQSNQTDLLKHGTKVNPPLHFGEAHPRSKLSADAVREIRSTPYETAALTCLARKNGVHLKTVRRIHQRKAWVHI